MSVKDAGKAKKIYLVPVMGIENEFIELVIAQSQSRPIELDPIISASVGDVVVDDPKYFFNFGVNTIAPEVAVPEIKIPVLSGSPRLLLSTGAFA